MDPQQVFLSYSRRDFAFAEALAATFQRQDGVEPWLDVQRLAPGTDWSATIDEAIDLTDVLVLVASRAALASPYVTAEWRRALAARTTIHVCVVGAVTLPEELAGYPVHDLRSRFWARARTMGELIAASRSDSAARVRSSTLLPAPVLALLTMCLVIAGILVAAVREAVLPASSRLVPEHLSPLAAGLSLAMVATAVTLLVVAARVPWRRSSSSAISYNLGFAAICGYILLTNGMIQAHVLTGRTDAQAGYGIVLLLASAAGAAVMTRSRSVYLWTPTGEGYYQVRQRILGLPVGKRRRRRMVNPKFSYQWAPFAQELSVLPGNGSRTTFEVRCDQGDEQIAHTITDACVAAGLVKQAGPDSWVLRVVSSKTDYVRASAEISKLGAKAVCVLVDSLRLPEDSVELRQRQWLDFRQQTPEGLDNLLRRILGASGTGMDSTPVPLAPNVSLIPFMTHGFAVAARTHLSCIGAFSLGLFAATPTTIVFLVGVAALAPMALLWWLLRATVARTITATGFRGAFGLLGVCVLLWTAGLGVLHLGLAVCGLLELLALATSFVRPLYQLPPSWLPDSVTPNKARLVRPKVFTSYVTPVAVMFFGIAATIPSFLR